MEDTIDNALAPIEASIEKAKIYSPDNLTNTDVAQKKLDKDGNIIVEVDHGNGVATIGTEAKGLRSLTHKMFCMSFQNCI